MGYVDEVLEQVKEKNADQPEFLQAVTEVLETLKPVVEANEELYRREAVLERITEPDRAVHFRVPWVDDNGQVQVFSTTTLSDLTKADAVSILQLT